MMALQPFSLFFPIVTNKKSISNWRFGDALHIESFDRGKGEMKTSAVKLLGKLLLDSVF